MIILKVLLLILCIALILLLFLLIPFSYTIKAKALEEKIVNFNVAWLFGMVCYQGSYIYNQGSAGCIKVLGIKCKNIGIDEQKKEKKKKVKAENKNKKKRVFSIEGLKYIIYNFKKVLRHILPDKIEGYATIGFDDPYYTGVTCAIVESLRAARGHNLSLNYSFEDEVYEGELYIKGRIFLIYIVYIALRLYLNKPVRKLIFN